MTCDRCRNVWHGLILVALCCAGIAVLLSMPGCATIAACAVRDINRCNLN